MPLKSWLQQQGTEWKWVLEGKELNKWRSYPTSGEGIQSSKGERWWSTRPNGGHADLLIIANTEKQSRKGNHENVCKECRLLGERSGPKDPDTEKEGRYLPISLNIYQYLSIYLNISSVSISQYLYLSMHIYDYLSISQYSNISIFQYLHALTYQYSNISLFQYLNTQIYQYSYISDPDVSILFSQY